MRRPVLPLAAFLLATAPAMAQLSWGGVDGLAPMERGAPSRSVGHPTRVYSAPAPTPAPLPSPPPIPSPPRAETMPESSDPGAIARWAFRNVGPATSAPARRDTTFYDPKRAPVVPPMPAMPAPSYGSGASSALPTPRAGTGLYVPPPRTVSSPTYEPIKPAYTPPSFSSYGSSTTRTTGSSGFRPSCRSGATCGSQ